MQSAQILLVFWIIGVKSQGGDVESHPTLFLKKPHFSKVVGKLQKLMQRVSGAIRVLPMENKYLAEAIS